MMGTLRALSFHLHSWILQFILSFFLQIGFILHTFSPLFPLYNIVIVSYSQKQFELAKFNYMTIVSSQRFNHDLNVYISPYFNNLPLASIHLIIFFLRFTSTISWKNVLSFSPPPLNMFVINPIGLLYIHFKHNMIGTWAVTIRQVSSELKTPAQGCCHTNHVVNMHFYFTVNLSIEQLS